MELVTSHVGADFDALASMIAARKLYPGAVAALSGGMDRNVREFVNLFEESLGLSNAADLDPAEIRRLIVVDTQHARRLGRFRSLVEQGVEVHLYDHHPVSVPAEQSPGGEAASGAGESLHAKKMVTRALGATTTLLLQILRERGLEINAFEATLFALGIYEETGGLVFSHTTIEDIEMAAYLLRCGANLDVVSDYINRSLTEKQRELLNHLILNTEYHTVQGVRIAVARAQSSEYVDEIALLTHKLCDIENVGAVFALIETSTRPGAGDRLQVPGSHQSVFLVARSKVDAIDVAEVLAPLGGGGHHRAASAMLKNISGEEAREKLLKVLNQQVSPQATAADIMETPVRTVDPETTVEEAARVMLRYGYSGLAVVSDEQVVGIVTRRDVDRARHHRLHAAPVKAVMTSEVPVAAPQATLYELQETMVGSKVGRIPVVSPTREGDRQRHRLVGIVTRSGLLQALYGQHSPASQPKRRSVALRRDNVEAIMDERLPDGLLAQLRGIGEIGDRLGLTVYVVGGFVRDLMLGVENLDIDVMTETDGIAVAQEVVRECGGRLVEHERFGTAVVVLPGGQKIDFATARTEFYKFPAALPDVEFSSIQEDLYRRDFTINAMAVQLNRDHFGEMLDFFGGRDDLEARTVRVLHNLSFVEDPTRIIRAVRFEQRYDFKMDRQAETLISQAADIEMFSRLTRERMRDELILLLREQDPISAIHRMSHLDILKHIHPRLRFDGEVLELLHRVNEELAGFDSRRSRPTKLTRWLLYFLPLLKGLELSEVKAVAQEMKLGDRVGKMIASACLDIPLIDERLRGAMPPSAARRLLHPLSPEVLLFAAAKSEDLKVRNQLHLHIYEWSEARPEVTGEMLLQHGLQPGPHIGRALEAALDAKLDGVATTQQEQLQIALNY